MQLQTTSKSRLYKLQESQPQSSRKSEVPRFGATWCKSHDIDFSKTYESASATCAEIGKHMQRLEHESDAVNEAHFIYC